MLFVMFKKEKVPTFSVFDVFDDNYVNIRSYHIHSSDRCCLIRCLKRKFTFLIHNNLQLLWREGLRFYEVENLQCCSDSTFHGPFHVAKHNVSFMMKTY